jgi:hypothetical protein
MSLKKPRSVLTALENADRLGIARLLLFRFWRLLHISMFQVSFYHGSAPSRCSGAALAV